MVPELISLVKLNADGPTHADEEMTTVMISEAAVTTYVKIPASDWSVICHPPSDWPHRP